MFDRSAACASWKICRQGFYRVVFLCEGCRVQRRGKPLPPMLRIATEEKADYGVQGRLRPVPLTPCETQTNYGGLVAARLSLDVQDMRRVLDPELWLG